LAWDTGTGKSLERSGVAISAPVYAEARKVRGTTDFALKAASQTSFAQSRS